MPHDVARRIWKAPIQSSKGPKNDASEGQEDNRARLMGLPVDGVAWNQQFEATTCGCADRCRRVGGEKRGNKARNDI